MRARKGTVAVAITALFTALISPIVFAAPANAAVVCDFFGFEIDGNTPANNCPPGFDDWSSVDADSSGDHGPYKSTNDATDPAGWYASGNPAQDATILDGMAYSTVDPGSGDFLLYTAWNRAIGSGTSGFVIELTNAPERTGGADKGDGIDVPQPDRSAGGNVYFITAQGGGAITLDKACTYTSQANYPGTCTTPDNSAFAAQAGNDNKFIEIGMNLTQLSDIAPGCPPTAGSTVYIRSYTGNYNIQAWLGALTVDPPSTCGTLEVTKKSLNDLAVDDATVFPYAVTPGLDADHAGTIDGSIQINQTDSSSAVEAGDYTLDETIPDGAKWAEQSIVCTVGDGEPIDVTNGESFPVVAGETTSCVITNATSFLDVSKVVNPPGTAGTFNFSIGGTPVSLSGGETSDPIQFAPGTSVTITEEENPLWKLKDITCTGQDGDPVNGATGEITVTTPAGGKVNCVYTNETSFVKVDKATQPAGSEQLFSFSATGQSDFQLSDGSEPVVFQYAPDTDVTITESLAGLLDWDLTGMSCVVGGQPTGTPAGNAITVKTVAGQTTECTFTNRQDGKIIVNKTVVGTTAPMTFDYTGTWLGGDHKFTIDTTNGLGTRTFENVTPGQYTLTEVVGEGYDATNLICKDSTAGTTSTTALPIATINLDPGETVECTYTNTLRATLTVDKETVPNEYDQDFGFVFSNGQFNTPFTLNDSTDDESNPWRQSNLLPGTYTVTETVPGGWELTGIDCGVREGSTTTITLEPGQVVNCVFTNTATKAQVSLTKTASGIDDSLDWSFSFALKHSPDADVVKPVSKASPTATWTDLVAGQSYTLVEQNVPAGWTAGAITCTGLADADGDASNGFQFVATPAMVLECTANNAAAQSEVSVEKIVKGVADTYEWSFDFTIDPLADGQPATKTAEGTGNGSATVGWNKLIPGETYTITETSDAGWVNGTLVCSGVTDTNTDPMAVTFVAGIGVKITCEVTNTAKPGQIDVTKTAVGGDGMFTFKLQPLDGDGKPVGDPIEKTVNTQDGTAVATFLGLIAGSRFSLSEAHPGDEWVAGELSCTVTHAGEGQEPVEIDPSDFTVQPGDSIECAITNTKLGAIVIEKQVTGANGTFDFTGTWLESDENPTGAFQITTSGGEGSAEFHNLAAGTYTVNEIVNDAYNGTLLYCNDSTKGTDSTESGLTGTINLDPGETVTCRYSNVQYAKITIDKETVPDNWNRDFDFAFGHGDSTTPFTLNDGTEAPNKTKTFDHLLPGTYTVDETVPANWSLSGISCGTRDGDGTSIELMAGDDVTCVFTNTAVPGRVTLEKTVEGVDPSLEWSFGFELIHGDSTSVKTVDNSDLPDSAKATWGELVVGDTYTLVEQDVPEGWTAGDIECTVNDGESDVAVFDLDAEAEGFQFLVTPGLVLDCTANNVAAPGDVTVTKTVEGVADDYEWSFDFTIDPVEGEQDATQAASGTGEESDSVSWGELIPGKHYTITEETVEGWEQGEIVCTAEGEEGPLNDLNGNDPGVEFIAGVGVSVSCEVTNTAVPVDIDVTKLVSASTADAGEELDFDFALQPLDGDGEPVGDALIATATVTVGDDGAGSDVASFTDLVPGSRYSLSEVDPGSPWTAGELVCEVRHAGAEASEPLDVNDFTIQPGDSITCSITNSVIDLSIVKSDDGVVIDQGDSYDYTFTATNKTPGTVVEDVVVTDEIPATLMVDTVALDEPGNVPDGWTWELTGADSDGFGGTLVFTKTADWDVVGGDPEVYEFTVTVTSSSELPREDDNPQGKILDIENTAVISSSGTDEHPGDNTSTEVTPVKSLAVSLSPMCVQNAPWIEYSVTPYNTDGEVVDPEIVMIWWTPEAYANRDPSIPASDIDAILADGASLVDEIAPPATPEDGVAITGKQLWPGASVDANGNGIAWPGWKQLPTGQWVLDPSAPFYDIRTSAIVEMRMNPSTAATEAYPPSSDCAPKQPTPGMASTGFDPTWGVYGGAALLILGAGLLLVLRRRRSAE
ncbi:prealbumin-like fold domain-containing protein [Agromyces soli]